MTQASPISSSLNIPSDVAERLRARRIGYDQVHDIVQKYDSISPDERAKFGDLELANLFVLPMFAALGWVIDVSPYGLRFEGVYVLITIKKSFDQSDIPPIDVPWSILTNFETIQSWKSGGFQDARKSLSSLQGARTPILVTSPYAYLTDEDPKHDLLAAPVFYERLVKAQSPDIKQSTNQQTNQQTTQPSDNQTAETIEVAGRALADAPSAVDLLGFSDYADAIADFIKSEKTEKPLTIGIDAPWGMGKTTLMRMIRERLVMRDAAGKKQHTFPTVWFNAWRFDQEKALWAALALAILTETRRQLNWRQRVRLWFRSRWTGVKQLDGWRIAQKLLKVVAYIIIILGIGYAAIVVLKLDTSLPQSIQDLQARGGIIGALAFLASVYLAGRELLERVLKSLDIKIEQLSDVSKSITEERVNFLSQFEYDFQDIASILTDGGKWPIVVFIDDLERCTPPRPAEIMEAINLFLGSIYTVFVIGMDAQMVAGSIESKYKDLKEYLAEVEGSSGVTLGQRFVEKIVQLNFQIPRADPEKFASFIGANLSAGKYAQPEPMQAHVAQAEQLIKAEQRAGKSLDKAVREVQEKQVTIPQAAIQQARQEIFAKSFDDSAEVRAAVRLATPYMGFNPRKLKRFINNFRLQALVTNRRGLLASHTIALPLLAKWMIIVTRWPNLVNVLESDADAVRNLKKAYQTRELLHVAQTNPTQQDAAQVLTAELAQLLEDTRLNRLSNSADLLQLLNDMSDQEIDALPNYLQLAQLATPSRT